MTAFEVKSPTKTKTEIQNLHGLGKIGPDLPEKLALRKHDFHINNILFLIYGHLAAAYGIYLMFTSAKLQTTIYALLFGQLNSFGISAGVHRLWTHRAYKAKMPLQIILLILFSTTLQGTIKSWVRDHRTHHKHSDTEADPHNASRGFFFSHYGWLIRRKSSEVKEKGKAIDMSDMHSDPLVQFQDKYKLALAFIFALGIPSAIPMYFWGETFNNAWHIGTMWRMISILNGTFLVNSLAHTWGYKPYDKSIRPVENMIVNIASNGEGFHNYHHVFPWDYRSSELGNNKLCPATWFIDFFGWIGWAYDMKTVPDAIIKARAARTGDGSNPIWGWGDSDQTEKERNAALIIRPMHT